MDREILFKAKRVDNSEWVEGYYLKKIDPLLGIESSFILNQGDMCSLFSWYKVDPSTVCQHTGRKDKNGKRTFEFDKVRVIYIECDKEMEERVAVIWCDEICSFSPFNWEYQCDGCDCFCEIESIEVIGNIHDKEENHDA